MNICTGLIDYYDQILTGFLFKRAVCHLSGDGRGERWVPHSFFLYNLIRNSCKKTHQKQDELKPNLRENWMSFPYDGEHFNSVSFPSYSIESCIEPQ